MCYSTIASGDYSTAMGYLIEAKADEALVNSGTISGKSLTFFADERLVAGVQAVDTAAMLRNVQSLKVVSHTPSANYCRHLNRTPADCAGDRTIGLLAQHVGTVVQGAVASVSSLKLTDGNGTRHRRGMEQHPEPGHGQQPQQQHSQGHPHNLVLEHVESLQSLDVHVLVAQLVGAAQAQSNQIEAQSKQIEAQRLQVEAQSKQIEVQSKQIEAQRLQAEAQSKQIAALNVKVDAIAPGNGSA